MSEAALDYFEDKNREYEFMADIKKQIVESAIKILEGHPDGLKGAVIARTIINLHKFNENTVITTVYELAKSHPKQVCKPSPGHFRLVKFTAAESLIVKSEPVVTTAPRISEDQFYEPFAEWLVNEVEECTKAIPLGRNLFRDKWGTPDVVGIRKSKDSDIIKCATEICSAEIKTDVGQLITAFGQACAYCVFSHKSYLVIPRSSADDERDRLDSLCQVFGIGLVLFDSESPSDPNFSSRVRPRLQQPDLFYANKYMKLIEAELFS